MSSLRAAFNLAATTIFDLSFTAVYVSDEFWADSNLGTPTIPAKIPSYVVFNVAADWKVTKNLKLIAGVSNLGDEKYYSRVFFNGSIEPAPGRAGLREGSRWNSKSWDADPRSKQFKSAPVLLL